ncbi:ent-kaurene oxidase, chloroplastic-like [Dorcoceras hygrometricum]|uniref:Ent-kaurene oxidase, chloroplastic-like n=1 Tax=Dorcoceras hygrometricum TaxID=472368 RepID=A0A2Z7BPG5_9LAMI|nr:ent-kaurene oxidase, chloroplastic-like [Dorcoceras hygrometricum]
MSVMARRDIPPYLVHQGGANSVVVLNAKEIAKEATMIERYSSISTRKLSNALAILTFNKCMVATSDYNEFHKVSKRHLLASTLGSSAQKRHRVHREIMMDRICKKFHAHLRGHPSEPVNFRKIFKLELFGLGLKQGMGIGREFKSIYVKELGATLSKEELFKILVADPLEGAIEVDWRDFFPYLKWIPNKKFEIKLQQMFSNRQAVMNALIKQQRTRVQAGEAVDCYFDYLLSQSTSLSEQLLMLLWEDLIGTSDTTLVATEWAMYELCRSPDRQKHLYSEIQKICGHEKLAEDKLNQIPYLSAVFQETLRKHSPPTSDTSLSIRVRRYTSWRIAISIYGCNMDENMLETPDEWKPERFVYEDSMDMHKTMAFGAGKRVCIGALQAMTISCVAIGRLVQEFSWSLMDEEKVHENVDSMGLTSHKLHPLLPILKHRN